LRDDRERLLDIAEAIERIEKYTRPGRDRFWRDELVQTWVLHHVQIIGEAARGVSEAFRQSHPRVPWQQIVGMRNILVHRYFGIDRDAVWSVVAHDLPELKRQVEAILRQG